MGKTKKDSEAFKLKKELRECQQEISTLQKELEKYQKAKSEDTLTRTERKLQKRLEKEAKKEVKPIPSKCEKCGTGEIVTTDIGVKYLDMCNNCKARKTRKKEIGKEEKDET